MLRIYNYDTTYQMYVLWQICVFTHVHLENYYNPQDIVLDLIVLW